MTRTGSSGSNGFGEDRIFTVAGEIVVLGHRLGKARESREERRGESPMGSVAVLGEYQKVVG